MFVPILCSTGNEAPQVWWGIVYADIKVDFGVFVGGQTIYPIPLHAQGALVPRSRESRLPPTSHNANSRNSRADPDDSIIHSHQQTNPSSWVKFTDLSLVPVRTDDIPIQIFQC